MNQRRVKDLQKWLKYQTLAIPIQTNQQYLHLGWRRVWGHAQDKMPSCTFGDHPKKWTNLVSEREHLGEWRNDLYWASETPRGKTDMLTARKNDIFFAPDQDFFIDVGQI